MNTELTLIELTELLAESTSTSSRVCELFLRELFSTVSQELIKGGTVTIKNIGTFKVVESKARTASATASAGKRTKEPVHKRISFTPAKSLADAVNQPFAQFETVILDDAVTDEQLAAIDEKYPSVDFDTHVEPEGMKSSESSEPSKSSEPSESSEISEPSESLAPSALSEVSEAPVAPAVERKPMLVGIPIDGPSHPVPEAPPVDEPKTDEYFYRPALRDAYSPTEEQLSASPKRDLRWLWGLLAVAVVAGLLWLIWGHNGMATSDEPVTIDTAELFVEDTSVVTDTVTATDVLSTIAEKHYHSSWFWVYIYEENKDIISDPDNVRPGTVVVIPPPEKYGIDANDPASLKKAQRRSWEILKLGKR